MPKAPFERIFSLAERKKVLAKVAKEHLKILIKSSNNKVLEVKAEKIDSAFHISGTIQDPKQLNYRDFDKVTALFHVDNERYFLTTRLKIKDDQWTLLNDPQLFKFNRRSAFRVYISDKVDMQFQVSSVRNIEVNKRANVIEFSTTGARIEVFAGLRFSIGATIKGSLQWGKGKILPIDALVVHSPAKNIYGVRFINLNVSTLNRLKMASIEIQQSIHFS